MNTPKLRNMIRRWRKVSGSLLLTAAVLWTVGATATARSFSGAAEQLEHSAALPLALLRYQLGDLWEDDALSLGASVALHFMPVLGAQREAIVAAWSEELQRIPDPDHDHEDSEGTVLTAPPSAQERADIADNGVPSRTLKPSDPEGYIISGSVYVNNASSCSLTAEQLSGGFAARYRADDAPQVLIIHTHGSEAYTMPAGEEYVPSDDHRTIETAKNMIRVGDEIAAVLADAGLGVLHDREMYDYPNYSGAYNRSLAAIEKYREQYPSILYILDVHRDAVEDAAGNEYKLLCAEEPHAAQLEFVIGSSGGGLEHPQWRENLKLACAVQETLLADYPTLMRPIIVRSSRYNQQVTTGSLLIEVGAAGNSLYEALAAARLFADGFARTVLESAEE